MNQKENDKQEETLVSCDVCMKEIPATEARSEEADDYVRQFCGLECYDKWRSQTPQPSDEK